MGDQVWICCGSVGRAHSLLRKTSLYRSNLAASVAQHPSMADVPGWVEGGGAAAHRSIIGAGVGSLRHQHANSCTTNSPCSDWLEALHELLHANSCNLRPLFCAPLLRAQHWRLGGFVLGLLLSRFCDTAVQWQQQSTGWPQPERAADASVATHASLSQQEHTPNCREPVLRSAAWQQRRMANVQLRMPGACAMQQLHGPVAAVVESCSCVWQQQQRLPMPGNGGCLTAAALPASMHADIFDTRHFPGHPQ